MTKKGRSFVSDEISHLMKDGPSKGPQKDKTMPQKQAVAVALDVARRKGFKTAPNPNDESSKESPGLLETGFLKRVAGAYGSARKAGGTTSQGIAHGLLAGATSGTAKTRRERRQTFGAPKPAEPRFIGSDHPENKIPKPTMTPKPAPKPAAEKPRFTRDMAAMSHNVGGKQVWVNHPDHPEHNNYRWEEKSMSVFDNLVSKEESVFDGLVQESRGSLFDEIISQGVDEEKSNWDDRLARTMTLSETLVEIMNSVKKK